MQVNDREETFIPDIIPPEVKEVDDSATKVEAPENWKVITVSPPPKSPEKPVVPAPFTIHHAIIGLGIAGASLAALFLPVLKPTTKVAIAGLGVTIGVILVYDDILQHQESGCGLESIINFVPCKTTTTITTVKKQ